MSDLASPQKIAQPYKKVIAAFKNRFDVQNGRALGYKGSSDIPAFKDTPKGIGDGLGTTGWCVSASQALLFDNSFTLLVQSRKANAKLVSIDIKEQYYGHCYNGSQNKWHTAILVQDSGINLIIDITCRQFGNNFIGKDIWDLSTWEKTFRSPLCKHKITDFDDNPLSIAPIPLNIIDRELTEVVCFNDMHDLVNISDDDRRFISDFFVNRIEPLNAKLLSGNINKFDYKYVERANELFEHFPFRILRDHVSILQFINKESAKNWITKLVKNNGYIEQYLVCSESFMDNCRYNNFDAEKININSFTDKTTYIVLEFDYIAGVMIDFLKNANVLLPHGVRIKVDLSQIINGGRKLAMNNPSVGSELTNTIYMKIIDPTTTAV